MADIVLKKNEKLDVREILKDLDKYEPRRRGWHWREPAPNIKMGPFEFHDMSKPLKQSVGLRQHRPAADAGHHDRDRVRTF